MQGRRIFVASNRGPAQFYRRNDGKFVPRQASGGLATALVSVAAQADLTWVAVAGSDIERQAFAGTTHRTIAVGGSRIETRYVPVPDETYQRYYDEISNNVLWFAQHYLLQSDLTPNFGPTLRQAWVDGYRVVNRAVADALIEEVRRLPPEEQQRAIIMVQDYHLYLVPGMLREALPAIAITHFVHIPWPTVRYWEFLPQDMVREIFASMLANDVVGLQTDADVTPFIMGTQEVLRDAALKIAERDMTLTRQHHATIVRAYPIAIDATHIRRIAHSKAAEVGAASIAQWFDRKTILRVDRLEPTKNIIRGLLAFDLLLEQHPELCPHVRFVMILVPSRENVRRYRQYGREVNKLAKKINQKHGASADPLVVTVTGNDQARALAAMRVCDVMLVNSIIDGMHLGAKEAAVANEKNGVLVISKTAGVAHELDSHAALIIAPLDVQETADALYQALTMDERQRGKLAHTARRRVESRTVLDWLNDQLRDVVRFTAHQHAEIRPPFDVVQLHPILASTDDLATSHQYS